MSEDCHDSSVPKRRRSRHLTDWDLKMNDRWLIALQCEIDPETQKPYGPNDAFRCASILMNTFEEGAWGNNKQEARV